MRRTVGVAIILLTSACGMREPLRPPEGQSLPVAPVAARETPTPEQLLVPPPIARPERIDELLRRSEERQDDRFNLPPPEVPAGSMPVPAGDDEPDKADPQ
jgi:hypothetical protein